MGTELEHLHTATDSDHVLAPLIERTGSARIPTPHGEFQAHAYWSGADDIEHVAYVVGDADLATLPLVRVHSECLTGDIFGSLRCDCGSQLHQALERIAADGRGVVLYLRGHEGRGIGLGWKLQAYSLQDEGLDTVDANVELGFEPDLRDYQVAAAILADLGMQEVRLLTNNPAKFDGLESHGVRVVEQVPLFGEQTPENSRYLRTKRDRMGHLLGPDKHEPRTPSRD